MFSILLAFSRFRYNRHVLSFACRDCIQSLSLLPIPARLCRFVCSQDVAEYKISLLGRIGNHDLCYSMSMPFPIAYCHAFWLILLNVSFATTLTLQSSSSLSNTLPSIINITNSSIPLADRGTQWECDNFYPTPSPDIASSCLDALHHMNFVPGSATRQYIWGPRQRRGRYDVYLPQRVYSCMSSQSITSSFD